MAEGKGAFKKNLKKVFQSLFHRSSITHNTTKRTLKKAFFSHSGEHLCHFDAEL
jgi:hypothetical protein